MHLETSLCRLHQRKHCVLVGNGTAGLYLALRALQLSSKRIALPNGVCANIPIAVYLAGAVPVFLDISSDNLGLAVRALEDNVADAAIGVHAYGYPSDIATLGAHCADRGMALIEDAAVAQGVTVDDRPAGSFGEVSIVSFGAGKVVEAGVGGAVLTDDAELFDAVSGYDSELPVYSDAAEQTVSELGRYHTRLYNTEYLSGHGDGLADSFKPRALAARGGFLHRFPRAAEAEICDRLARLETLIDGRRRSANRFAELFSDRESSEVSVVHTPEGSVPWRFNLLVHERRDDVLRALLAEREKVSSWYPSVDMFFAKRSASGVATPIADAIACQILNLWIDESVDAAYADRISDRILHLVSQPSARPTSLSRLA